MKENTWMKVCLKKLKHPTFDMLKKIMKKGKEDGVFREDLNDEQLILSLINYIIFIFFK